MLLSGYFPDLVYERGKLDQSLPFDALRRQSHINERARAADGADDFSRRIRDGLPGMPRAWRHGDDTGKSSARSPQCS